MNMHVATAAISGILVQTVHHRWFEVNSNEMFNNVFFVCARVDLLISLFFFFEYSLNFSKYFITEIIFRKFYYKFKLLFEGNGCPGQQIIQ